MTLLSYLRCHTSPKLAREKRDWNILSTVGHRWVVKRGKIGARHLASFVIW